MNEITPYVRDPYDCIYCKNEAEFECPYCQSLGIEQYVCSDHAVKRKRKFYCPKCNQRLHEIQPRFVGSYRALAKKNERLQHKVMVKPTIHGKNEENDRIKRDEL